MRKYIARLTVVQLVFAMTASLCYGANTFVPPKGTIQSLCVRDTYVFASTREGIYRALKSDRQWKKLSIPESMPIGGKFVTQPKTTDTILYIGAKYLVGSGPDAQKKVFGLYRSVDNGRNWNLISNEYDFREVYCHANGTIYATAKKTFEIPAGASTDGAWVQESDAANAPKIAIRDLVMMSKNHGKSWRDITGSIAIGGMIYGIFQDPDHPDLVCLGVNMMRNYVCHADDESYNWKSEREWDWMAKHETDEMFFRRGISSDTIAYAFRPTLSNYFAKGAPANADSAAFDIVPAKTTYKFRASESKTIDVSISFLPEGRKVTLADFRDGTDMWSVKVINPSGQRIRTKAVAYSAVMMATDRNAAAAEVRKGSNFSSFTIDEKHSYSRSLDMGKLYDFSQSGKYRVQLVYDSMGVADKEKGQWSGSFAGEVFNVVVK